MSEARKLIRIAGTTISGDKKALVALTYIPGVGFSLSNAILRRLGLDPHKKLSLYSEQEISKLRDFFENPDNYDLPHWIYNRQRCPETGKNRLIFGSDFELTMRMDISRLKKMKCWRGLRHSLGLKVRGQRTRTTGRSGPTVGYVKKKGVKSGRS